MSWGRLGTSYYFSGCRASHLQLVQELYALHISRSGAPSYYSTRVRPDDRPRHGRAAAAVAVLDEAAESGCRSCTRASGSAPSAARPRGAVPGCQRPGRPRRRWTVAPALRLDGAPGTIADADALPVLFLGAEGHGVVHVSRAEAEADPDPADWRFRLARLATPAPPALRRLVVDDGGFRWPGPAAALPVREAFYPRLRHLAPVTSSDGAFAPPAISEPTLVLRAAFGDAHELDLSWEWAYDVGGRAVRAPLAGTEGAFRDPQGERAVLESLDLPFADFGLPTPLAPTPACGGSPPCGSPPSCCPCSTTPRA